jgi:hypothetical protein
MIVLTTARNFMKSSFAILSITAASFCLSACASSTSAELQTALEPAASVGTSVECDGGCKLEWERAQLWLGKHAPTKVQTTTDILLQTYNPPGNNAWYGFSITKEPLGGDRYKISADLACANMIACSPKAVDVRNALLYYVKTGDDLLTDKAGVGVIK